MADGPHGILFLCTGNSCRSQMAEALVRRDAYPGIKVYSAGVQPAGYVHPLAIEVMKEIGLDLTGHRSKHLQEVPADAVDLVITVCGHAEETCPAFPGRVQRLHWPIPDPARASGSRDEVLKVFRSVRDDLTSRVSDLLRQIAG
ncbi:MAG: arsenate reductase ArsC [Planctomycetes bacterium]|nr:arsenate reductase ArsC [Planctomycetota bacterium]